MLQSPATKASPTRAEVEDRIRSHWHVVEEAQRRAEAWYPHLSDEIESELNLVAWRAAEGYEPGRGVPYAAYLGIRLNGAIREVLRMHGRLRERPVTDLKGSRGGVKTSNWIRTSHRRSGVCEDGEPSRESPINGGIEASDRQHREVMIRPGTPGVDGEDATRWFLAQFEEPTRRYLQLMMAGETRTAVAARCGVGESQVYSLLSRARERFRALDQDRPDMRQASRNFVELAERASGPLPRPLH